MKQRTEMIPVILLGSGVALTACGLAFIIMRGAETPGALIAVILVGIVDGLTGMIWSLARMLSRRAAAPTYVPPDVGRMRPGVDAEVERDVRMKRAFALASGILTAVFLVILAALAFSSQRILGWFANGHVF